MILRFLRNLDIKHPLVVFALGIILLGWVSGYYRGFFPTDVGDLRITRHEELKTWGATNQSDEYRVIYYLYFYGDTSRAVLTDYIQPGLNMTSCSRTQWPHGDVEIHHDSNTGKITIVMTNPSYDDLKSPSRGSWRIWLKFDYFTEISPFNTGQEPEVTYDLGPLNSKLECNLNFTISQFQLRNEYVPCTLKIDTIVYYASGYSVEGLHQFVPVSTEKKLLESAPELKWLYYISTDNLTDIGEHKRMYHLKLVHEAIVENEFSVKIQLSNTNSINVVGEPVVVGAELTKFVNEGTVIILSFPYSPNRLLPDQKERS